MARIPLMAGNWKMNKSVAEGVELVKELSSSIASLSGVEVAVCPPATALYAVGQALQGSQIALGAQDIFWEEKGAYTGLLSASMLKDVGCKYVIIGHSERRGRFGTSDASLTVELASVFGDNDATVNRKAQATLAAGLDPIICVGETLQERQAGTADVIIGGQVKAALGGFDAQAATRLVIAYEPVWAIGTGEVCDPIEANRIIGLIRSVVKECLGEAAATQIRILYGGSVSPDNVDAIMAQAEIDGTLVGGASLQAEKFTKIALAGKRS